MVHPAFYHSLHSGIIQHFDQGWLDAAYYPGQGWVHMPCWACLLHLVHVPDPPGWGQGQGHQLQWPQGIYQTLKQVFELDTAANHLDKLSKFLNTLQSTGELTVQFGGLPTPSSMLKEELWAHVVLCGLAPGCQHIKNGYTGADRVPQHWNGCLTPAVCSTQQATSITSTLPLCLTVCAVRPITTTSLRSAPTCNTPRRSTKPIVPSPRPALTRASHSQPSLQVPHLQSLLVKQVESCSLQTSPSLIQTGTQAQEPCTI